MKAKYKLTRFARLSIFLLAISPLCYIGAGYIQENPEWSDIKNELVEKAKEKVEHMTSDEGKQDLREEVKDLETEIEELKDELKKKDEKIRELSINPEEA